MVPPQPNALNRYAPPQPQGQMQGWSPYGLPTTMGGGFPGQSPYAMMPQMGGGGMSNMAGMWGNALAAYQPMMMSGYGMPQQPQVAQERQPNAAPAWNKQMGENANWFWQGDKGLNQGTGDAYYKHRGSGDWFSVDRSNPDWRHDTEAWSAIPGRPEQIQGRPDVSYGKGMQQQVEQRHAQAANPANRHARIAAWGR